MSRHNMRYEGYRNGKVHVCTYSSHFANCQRVRSTLDALRTLVEQGQLKPVVDSVLPLREVTQAHQRLEEGGVRGKIVLQVEGGEHD